MDNPFKGLSRGQLIATAIGSVAVLGYLEYRRHATTGSWNPFTSGASAAVAASTATTDAASSGTSDTGLGGNAGGGTGALAPTPVTGASADLSSSSPYTLNTTYPSAQQWAQAAQAGLTSIGYDPQTIAAALGAYLANQPLTAAQESVVQVAVGEYGTPTQPNGMPYTILTQPAVTTSAATSTPGTAPSTPTSSGTTTPSSPTTPTPAAPKPVTPPPAAPGNLRATAKSSTSVAVSWAPVAGATDYQGSVTYQGKTVQNKSARTPAITFDGLTPDHTYTFHITATGPGGRSGTAQIAAKTPKS